MEKNTANKSELFDGQEREHAYYRAVVAKDTRFDGVFFTGIKTTGIYCRPVCSAKTPRASSCVFFSSAAAAEAGARPRPLPATIVHNFGDWLFSHHML